MSKETSEILLNKEVIAVNQGQCNNTQFYNSFPILKIRICTHWLSYPDADSLGVQGKKVKKNGDLEVRVLSSFI